jgi:hypothetical protein
MVPCLGFTLEVSEDKLIRLENLKRVQTERGLTIGDLADRLGTVYSFARDLLAGKKPFGEKLARKVEEKLLLPRQWLDQVGAPIPPEVTDGNGGPPADDLVYLLSQLLHDLADLPEHQRLEGANAAIGAVSEVKTGTTAKAEQMRKSAASAAGASAPKTARPRSPQKSPTAARTAKHART